MKWKLAQETQNQAALLNRPLAWYSTFNHGGMNTRAGIIIIFIIKSAGDGAKDAS